MDVGMYNSDHYQVSDMTSASSAYPYYPNCHSHNYTHLHHHHMHHNPPAEILTGFTSQTHITSPTAATINSPTNHSVSMYHEYGLISSDPNFYESDNGTTMVQSYYPNQTNLNEHHGVSNALQHTTPSTIPPPPPPAAPNNDILSDPGPNHVVNTDNGLSYTNLDYMCGTTSTNSLYLHQTDDKSSVSHNYNQGPLTANAESTNVHSQGRLTVWQSPHPNHIHSQQHSSQQHHSSGYLDNSPNSHQIGVNQLQCLQNQPQLNALSAGPNEIHNRDLNNRRDSQIVSQQTSQIQSPQTQMQTYKWMQVKRNVPKPQGK